MTAPDRYSEMVRCMNCEKCECVDCASSPNPFITQVCCDNAIANALRTAAREARLDALEEAANLVGGSYLAYGSDAANSVARSIRQLAAEGRGEK